MTSNDATFFGHPRGLATLFFTEMWERFSYYGMRALLILFMTAAPATGGMGYDAATAGSVYGLYTFGVYALALPGGWIADRLIGQRRAVLYGGILIALGHYSLAVPSTATFYVGLVLIVFGTGLLKPNISAIVGDLYTEKGARRDAAFSIFYMGINVGGFFGPLICSWLGEPREGAAWVNWHYGFGAAGVGMTFALIQYVAGARHLQGAGELKEDSGRPERLTSARRQFSIGLVVAAVLAAAATALSLSGAVSVALFAERVFYVVTALFIAYFAIVILFVARDQVERRRLTVCFFLCLGAAMFWSGLRTRRIGVEPVRTRSDGSHDLRHGTHCRGAAVGQRDFHHPARTVVGMVWVALGARNPSMAVKFGLGLGLLGVGFLVMAWASMSLADGRVGMRWLVATYFFHTVGELCLSPVGLSSMTKLAPGRLQGQMMGTWFMGAAIGNLVAGMVTRFLPEAETMEAAMQNGVQLFGMVAAIAGAAGLLFIAFARPLRRMQSGVN